VADELLDTPLVAAARWLDMPAVVGPDGSWTWRQIHQASMTFASALDDATAVCNLCSSRAAFLVTGLAALRKNVLIILPPSGGNADLAGVLRSTRKPLIVVDDPRAIQPAWRDAAAAAVCQPTREPQAATDEALAWQPAWQQTSVLLYTSGSTGTPEPQPKTMRQLGTGALVLGARLAQDIDGGLAAVQRIVCSVPPQHMFGLEASVMLSLVHGIPVLDRRPLLPADVQQAFAESPPAAWIATPLHLRSLVQMDLTVQNCSVVIASTMPLVQTLAQQAEDRVHAPVLEIYGSTETGVVAMRRSARDVDWLAVRDVRIEPVEDGALAFGSHFASPAKLLDQVEPAPNGRFSLLGRQADLIKIAGRRASLAGLNLLLHELPGLDDGVFYMPASGSPTERLVLIYAGAPIDRPAAEQWLRSRLDPAFMPRTIIHVDRLPRSDSGKLPRQALDQLYAAWQAATS
jgi:acyl-coenzyme A synthetase/AMP-(fatty) acid ligase